MSSPTRRVIGGTVIGILAFGLLLLLCGKDSGKALLAVTHLDAGLLVATLAMGVLAVVLRGEVWRICLRSAGAQETPRSDLHAANATTFVANAFNHYVGPLARVGVMRKLHGERAPRPCQMLAADLPVLAVEVGLLAIVLAVAVGSAPVAWWTPLAAGAVAVTAAFLLRGAARKFAHRPSSKGLSVLRDRRSLAMIGLLMLGAISLQLARTWVLLHAAGLHPHFWQAAFTFAATGALAALPLGPATSSGATMAVFGGSATASVASAGMMLTATALAAALLYALWTLLVFLVKKVWGRPARTAAVTAQLQLPERAGEQPLIAIAANQP